MDSRMLGVCKMNGYYVTIETRVTYTTFVEADNKDDAYEIAKDRFVAGEIEPDNPNPTDIDSVTVKDAEE
jgi:uncharacterized membrane protein